MRRSIENLLDFDQIEQGLLVLEWRDCELNDVVNEVVNALRPTAEVRKQSLTFNQPTRPLVIRADSNRLTQIVYNLLDNAVKYTPEGGHVRISRRRQKNDVEIEVADNGLGISDDQIAHLFSRYYRATEIRRSDVKGSGLGLYIVKTLVEAHRGTRPSKVNLVREQQ